MRRRSRHPATDVTDYNDPRCTDLPAGRYDLEVLKAERDEARGVTQRLARQLGETKALKNRCRWERDVAVEALRAIAVPIGGKVRAEYVERLQSIARSALKRLEGDS